ncbi:MAG TPA: PAS domain-containing protein [Vicinamibacterales bacterium]|jgi:PAS domain S-box-containing protein
MHRLVLAWCLLLGFAAVARPQDGAARRILVVHQYSMDMPFRTAFDPAFQRALRSAISGPLEIYSEALETYRFSDASHGALMERYFREKYKGLKLDVVVAVYDTALQFVRAHHDELFPGVPVVGLTTKPIAPALGEDITGVSTGSATEETARLAHAFHPKATHLFVVEGALQNSGALQEAAQRLLEIDPQLAVTYLTDRPLNEVTAALHAAPPDSIVLYLRQMIGPNWEPIDQRHGLNQIKAVTNLPMYGTSQMLVGGGLVGGYVSSVEGNALRVAGLAARVALGASAGSIAPEGGVLVPLFDSRELKARGIADRQLPPGSRILFRETSFWQAYRVYVMGALALFAAQACLIAALLLQRRRRRTAEVALRDSENRNRATLLAIPDLMFLVSKAGILLDYYATNTENLFTSPERFIGKRVDEVLPAEPGKTLMRELALATPGSDPRVVRYPLTLNGDERAFEARLVACDDERVLTIVRDITKERRAYAEVLLSRQRYALATGACGVGVWDWNLETLDFYIDPAFMTILGYDGPGPTRFEQLLDYVHPSDRARTEASARACAEQRSDTYVEEHRMVSKGGHVRWFQCRGSVVADDRGLPSRVVGTFWDITERKETDAALHESAMELQSRHAEIQDLAGRLIVAQEAERRRIARDLHDDLSQRLALLTIDVDLLARDHRTDGLGTERLDKISKRAADIASDVHALSHQLHPTKLEALGLVSAIQSLCRDVSRQHGVSVEFKHDRMPSQIPPDVALCLYRIAQESLRNVVKHSGAARAMVRMASSPDELRLHVADPGCGFDMTKNAHPGLGLVSMRERVNFAGGDIVVHSEPGRGTRIGVRVPIAAARSSESAMDSLTAIAPGRLPAGRSKSA